VKNSGADVEEVLTTLLLWDMKPRQSVIGNGRFEGT